MFYEKSDVTKYLDIWLLILRICVAAFMITHGWPKLMKLLNGGEIKFADPFGLGPAASLVLVVFSEFVCSIAIALGVFTRWATVPLIVTMLVAAFIAHTGDPFRDKEMALMYLLMYGTILVLGPGKYAVENYFRKKSD